MTPPRTALVTGASQNLGLALVARLAAGLTANDRVLLTGRDLAKVEAAASELAARQLGASIEPLLLDVRDRSAIADLAAELGEVDIVFSSATSRMSPTADPVEEIDAVVDTNNLATITFLREFAPRMRTGGRLVIVASALGTLDKLSDDVRGRFADAATEGLDAVEQLVEAWRASVKAGVAVDDGFGTWLNIPSKVAQVAAVRAVARERRDVDVPRGVSIVSLCPGLIDTPASRPWFRDMSAAQTPDDAAAWPAEFALATTADPAMYGELVQFGRIIPWETGMPVPHRALT